MSNLVKSFALVCNDDKRIIDSNEAVTLKLQEIRRIMAEDNGDKGGFTLGLNPENVEELLDDSEQMDMAEISSVNNEELNLRAESIIEEAKAKAKEIMERAESDAAHIMEEAGHQAEDIKAKAHAEGFEKGTADGRKNIDNELLRINKEYDEKCRTLESEYPEKLNRMEPELVDVIFEVFADVTKAISVDQKGMIMALIDKVLSGAEASSSYIIKAGSEDAKFLRENKESIMRNVAKDINIEIVEDISMKKNECLIDTDYGIYDCSLDIQLENLMQSIRILSCTMEK